MTRRSKVKALPKPDLVRKAFEVPGLFKPKSHQLMDKGFEVFGVLTTPTAVTPLGIGVGRPESTDKWPFSGNLPDAPPEKRIFLSWQPLRPAALQRSLFIEYISILMNALTKSLPYQPWVEDLIERRLLPRQTWSYLVNRDKQIIGPDLMKAVSGDHDIELYVQLHTECLQKCLYCPAANHKFSRQQQDADLDFINELIAKIAIPAAANGLYTTFRLDANDISAHPWLPEIMEAISNGTGNPVSLILPAQRLSIRSGADAIADLPGLVSITTTVFGSSLAVHDQIAVRQGAFAETLRAFKLLSNKPVWLKAYFVLSKLACVQIGEVVDTVSHFGMDLKIQNLIADGREHNVLLQPVLPDIKAVLDGFIAAKEQILAASKRISIKISDFPVCFIPNELRHLVLSDNTKQSLYRYALSPVCKQCRHKDSCIGVSEAYIELYGTQAFAPEE